MHRNPDQGLTPRDTRRLLALLRDLNLAARLAIDEGRQVILEGCLTLDSPVELGVSYRVREGEERAVLHLVQEGADLAALLEGPAPRRLPLGLVLDESGRAASSTISARVDLDACDARTLEHFLRRIVRGLYAAA